MTLVDLRCEGSLHGRLDPDKLVLDVKCRSCSSKLKREVHHRWRLQDLADLVRRGEVAGIVGPSDPQFVHWRVTGSS